MKRHIYTLLLVCYSILCFLPGKYAYAATEGLELESQSMILMEATTGAILYEKDKDAKRTPASVTKLMTLLIALEAIEDGKGNLDDVVVASEHAAGLGGSQIYLEIGEKMSLQDLLIAIAVGSANDACVAVAEHLYGSETLFVDAMNQKAADIGMQHTHFCNPYGLPDEKHYTTAYDLALLGQVALKNASVMQLTTIKHYTLRENSPKPFVLNNTNKLLWWYSGADGLKTGWVGPESGYCLAATAEREGLRLIAVVLGAQEKHGNFRDAMKLFNFGFSNYRYISLFSAGEEVGECEVEKGNSDVLKIGSKESIGTMLSKAELQQDITTKQNVKDKLTAPIYSGDVIGTMDIIYNNDRVVESFDLVALNTIEKCSFWQQMKRVSHYLFW